MKSSLWPFDQPETSADLTCPAWYVAFVLTGSEEAVSRRLSALFPELEMIVPRRALREWSQGQWRSVEKIIFPGYVFFKADLSNEQHFCISRLTGVIRILEQNQKPQPVATGEMDQLLRLVDSQGLIGFSRISQSQGKVVVTSGPLLGCEGLIVGSDRRKGRIKICLAINGQSRNFDVGAEWISEAAD